MSVSEDRQTLIASMLDALNGRDPDAMRELVHPDYEFRARFAALEGRVYRGPAGFHDYFRDIDDGFEDLRWELVETVQPPDEAKLFAAFRFTARGRGSGIPIDMSVHQVWTFRDGFAWRNVSYASEAEALDAAGLSPS